MKTTITNCQYCNTEFTAKRTDVKFCSNACRQQAYLDRNYRPGKKSQQTLEAKEAQLCAQKKAEEAQLAEVQRLLEAQSQKQYEDLSKSTIEYLEKKKSDSINAIVDRVNNLLKKWITQLLEFDQQEGISLRRIKWLCDEINNFSMFDKAKLSNDYKHLHFIENILTPKVKNLYKELRITREQYVSLHLAEELKSQLRDTLAHI